MTEKLTRRELMRQAALAGGLTALGGVWTENAAAAKPRRQAANDKLNIAAIGAGGQGAGDIGMVSSENIVALCDVDEANAAETFKRFPNAKKYADFRKMLDAMGSSIDAVVVSTPDHTHAVAAAAALHLGKHVYCQKPLTHSVREARALTRLAARKKVATQMGTQGHAFADNIRAVELLRAGVIGPVREVHVVTDRPIWPQGMDRPTQTPPVPSTLQWDLWLGPAKERPYHPAYLPFVWRGWWDFGTGALGDMACHLMDVAFWALDLKYPLSVEAEGEPLHPDSGPKWSIIRYAFPKRGAQPPVTMVWYDGGKFPPAETLDGLTLAKGFNGSLFLGEKGNLLVEHGQPPRLLPEEKFRDMALPPTTLKRPENHYQEWIAACKTGTPTGSNFGYAGPMTETILLGNVAFRVGRKIEYDAKGMKAKNCPEAEQYLASEYRKGWSL